MLPSSSDFKNKRRYACATPSNYVAQSIVKHRDMSTLTFARTALLKTRAEERKPGRSNEVDCYIRPSLTFICDVRRKESLSYNFTRVFSA